MKNNPFKLLVACAIGFLSLSVSGQQLDKEVKVDISRKAARGKLAEITVNDEKKQLELLLLVLCPHKTKSIVKKAL